MKNEKNVIRIDLWKALAIVATAVLASAGSGIFGGIVVLGRDHFVLATTVEKVSKIEDDMDTILNSMVEIKIDTAAIKQSLKIKE